MGSSDPENDLSIFEAIGENYPRHGFSMLRGLDIYQGMSIIVAGYPSVIDEEGLLTKYTKLLSRIVSASDCNDDIALADISAAMPNMLGGAVLSIASEFQYLLGIHLGVISHEETTHKQIEEVHL